MTGTVFLVDDDASVLSAVARLIRSAGHKVEAFASPREFLERSQVDQPGCLIVDLRMPEVNGLEVQEAITRAGRPIPVILMSGQADIQSTVKAMKGGAIDFLIKPFDEQLLLEAIHRAITHDTEARAARAEHDILVARFKLLTPRERSVCLLVAAGRLNKQIAGELGVSEKTIKVHRAKVMKKLRAQSVAELVRMVDRVSEGKPATAS
jgi:FixJ family two-component response regulator